MTIFNNHRDERLLPWYHPILQFSNMYEKLPHYSDQSKNTLNTQFTLTLAI